MSNPADSKDSSTNPSIASATESPVPAPPVQESEEELAYANRPFRGWRLLGVIGIVVLVLAIISAIVDWVVIGPLEGRVF